MNKTGFMSLFGSTCILGLRISMALMGICLQQQGNAHSESPPDPPLVATAPAPVAWTIEVHQKKPRRMKPDNPKKTDAYKRLLDIYPLLEREKVEKVGNDWHREKFYNNHTSDSVWVIKGVVIFHYHHFPPDRVLAMPAGDHNSPVKGGFGLDFPDLDWMHAETFVKTVTYQGQRCYYYETRNASPLEGGDALNPPETNRVRAWINVKTRLPVAVEDAAVLKKYSFAKEAPDSIQLSGIFATAYSSITNTAKRTGTATPDQ